MYTGREIKGFDAKWPSNFKGQENIQWKRLWKSNVEYRYNPFI
jgi:hypothetical protein